MKTEADVTGKVEVEAPTVVFAGRVVGGGGVVPTEGPIPFR